MAIATYYSPALLIFPVGILLMMAVMAVLSWRESHGR